ncbi:hypothetical protein [Sulfurovum sp. AR]|uniref:hypothetical protein n=1 Tax=Sulfurovum sp. AR TaxID=1165841 RepID=UPI00025C4C31|nr:hypothetical protein [Sulfurovum sp. AR]EIF51025.1 hypothetical protein SULAR_06648 [Sulfurovum sp. AR]
MARSKKRILVGMVLASMTLFTSTSTFAKEEKGVICHYTGNGDVKSLSVAVSSHQDHIDQHDDYFPQTYFADKDGDGYGNSLDSMSSCTDVERYVLDNTDLDDNDTSITDVEPIQLVIEAGDVVYNSLGCADILNNDFRSLFIAAEQPTDFKVIINGVEESATNYNPLLNIALNSFSGYQYLLGGANIYGIVGTSHTIQAGGEYEIITTITESYFDSVNSQANFLVEFQIKILYPDTNGGYVPATLNYTASYVITYTTGRCAKEY